MNLFSPKIVKQLLTKYNAAPLKRLGQNFLISRGVLEKIIKTADLNRGEWVLEIGPGMGTITRELARRAKKVVAVEKDKKMVQILKETLKGFKNVKIIQGDILKITPGLIKGEGRESRYKLIANLPHYITSAVIRKFLGTKNLPETMVLMLQKEVAQRICAKPPKMSILAVSVQFFAQPEIVAYVSKGSFWPQPKVDSAIIKILPKKDLPKINPVIFFKVVRAGFSSPRKQLANNLAKNLKIDRRIISAALKKAKIEPSRRAETLNIEDWIEIEKYLISSL